MDHLCYFCLVFVMLSCASVYVWCLIVSIPDLCPLAYSYLDICANSNL